MTTTAAKPRQYRQKRYQAHGGECCAYCLQPFTRNQRVIRGLTKEPYHPVCRRESRMAGGRVQPPPTRPAGVCVVCGGLTDVDPPTRQGLVYHRECLM